MRDRAVAYLRNLKGSSYQLYQPPLTVDIFYIFPELLATVWLSPHNGPVNPKIHRSKETEAENLKTLPTWAT